MAAYLLGSVSFAILSSWIFGLADPRSYGSKNPGATNVLRSGNKTAAIFTLLGDAAKGWLAVFLAQKFGAQYGFGQAFIGLVALAVFFGHLYPVVPEISKAAKAWPRRAGVLLALDPLLGLGRLGHLGCSSLLRCVIPRWRR